MKMTNTKVVSMAKRYSNAGGGSMCTLRRKGLNARRNQGLRNWTKTLDESALLLEKVFNIKLHLLAHDEEMDDERGNPRKRLSVIPIYTPRFSHPKQRRPPTTVHLLLTNESSDTDPDAYSHAHLVLNPEKTLNGFRCSLCNKSFIVGWRMKAHKCKLGPTLTYPGGPRARQITVWERMQEDWPEGREEADALRRTRAKHYVVWRADLDMSTGRLKAISALTNGWKGSLFDRDDQRRRRRWDGDSSFDKFYEWACHLQRIQAAWWEEVTGSVVAKLKKAGLSGVATALSAYGTAMPCVSMQGDLRATVAHWNKHIDPKSCSRTVLRSKGFYRSVTTKDGVNILNWNAYDAYKLEWSDYVCERVRDLDSLDDIAAEITALQRDLDGMPPDVGGGYVELFRGNVSLPNIARYMGYKSAEEGGHVFYLPKGPIDGAQVEGKIHSNMAGGPSVVYDRVVDGRKVLTFDANSLYAWALSQDMPVGRRMFCIDRESGFVVKGDRQCSMGEMAWIDSLRRERKGIAIRTPEDTPTSRVSVAGASGKRYQPDGVDKENRTVYEFLGDYWHGSSAPRRQETAEKIADMEAAGWKVVTMWESDFNKSHPGATDRKAEEFFPPISKSYLTERRSAKWKGKEEDLIEAYLNPKAVSDAVSAERMYGFVEVDVCWGGGVGGECSEPPFKAIFYKGGNGHSADKVLLHTPYLATLVKRGYAVKRVHRLWEFRRGKPFKPFVDKAVSERLKRTPSANTWKLLVNSFYGGTILNKRNYAKTRMTDNDLVRGVMIMDPSFRDMTHVEGRSVHIVSSMGTAYMDSPTHIGKAVLDLAKARMVDFYFDVVDKIDGARLISFDTDAFTFHVAEETDVKTKLCAATLEAYFDDPDEPERGGPKKRGTPGLFHLESRGVSVRVAGPKMVCVRGGGGEVTKVTCKGVKRSALPEDPYPIYERLVDGNEAVAVSFPSTRQDPVTGAVTAMKMRRTMKKT
jgi:hypothetical protein